MSEKTPEQILGQIMDLLRELENVKVKTEWPIPVVRDRQGKLAKDYTLKDWYLKEQEEIAETLNEEISAWPLDGKPMRKVRLFRDGLFERILEENCDLIHTIFSKLYYLGYTEEEIEAGIRRSNEKAKERGLIY
jgi:hypothetical protein